MRLAGLLLSAAAALAQTSTTPSLVRGDMLESDPGSSGEFSIRTSTHQVFRFSFDTKTYFEQADRRTSLDKLHEGDPVEVVSETGPGTPLAYARTVRVLDRERPRVMPSLRPYRARIDHVMQMGNLTLAGVVTRLYGDRMVLHTRQGDDHTIGLYDTTFVENGIVVDATALKTNMRVFVRGARGLDEGIVAYQVMWGRILEPR